MHIHILFNLPSNHSEKRSVWSENIFYLFLILLLYILYFDKKFVDLTVALNYFCSTKSP